MAENRELAKSQEQQSNLSVFGSKENFETTMRMAKCLNASTIVPKTYQGDANLSNCVIAIEMANRINMSPLMVMQNLYVVYGNTGWSSKFLIASVNTCGKFKTPLRYEFKGKEGANEWSCRASAIDNSGTELKGSWVSIEMAKKEGWYTKAGSKWQTMPELMLQYRAGAFFQRAYAPEISMGMITAEELQDTRGKVVDAEYEDVTETFEESNETEVVNVDKETGEIIKEEVVEKPTFKAKAKPEVRDDDF